jgi:TolB protein
MTATRMRQGHSVAHLLRSWLREPRTVSHVVRAACAVAVALVLAGVVPSRLMAQRLPVLRQVRLPHPYYFRELYLPQLTSGPSAVTWSPNGNEVIYSMRGSLWRQRLDSDEAIQLTDGPGYDYQPDWSRDGRHVVFVTYASDQLQLRMLDLTSGETRTLIADGSVNVEPRFSPSGDRVAWVSTAHEGRFHVMVASIRDGALGAAARLTEEHDSALPRYYYARWDHYLSPTWSADGRDLVVVSNRGRIWGTGGLWRMEARAGAPMREVHYEETNWKARPDWAADGRIVWSSYAGRQWHQLFVLRPGDARASATPDAFQLTYGEFDVTGARWAPDGRSIAYISNESGRTSLHTVSVPGGERREIVARRRLYRAPNGTLRLLTVDARTQAALPARLSVRTTDGRHFAPDEAWMHGDDAFDRRERPFEFNYFHASGTSVVTMPAGLATIEAMHGLEYEPVSRHVTVRPGETTTVRVTLRRIDDPAARGWVSGDLHVHMNYGGTYRATPQSLVRQARAEGVRVVENLIVNKESRIPDIGHFSGRPDPASTREVLLVHDEEFHTSYWGHTGLLGLTKHLILPNYAAYAGTAAASLIPTNSDVLRLARAQGAVTGYVHPFDALPAPHDTTRPLTNAFPVDLASGLVDYYEALGFVDDFMATQRVWYAALNCGFRVAAGAGTDVMSNFASLRGPVGMNRVYARVSGTLTHRAFLDALKAGRTIATNGPLLQFSIDGREQGDELARPQPTRLTARVRLRSMVPVDHLEIVHNGVVVRTIPTSRGGRSADATVTLEASATGWFLLRAWSDSAQHPVLDLMPMATTSPIYVRIAGLPQHSPEDGRYFAAWMARLDSAAARFDAYNDPRERDATRRMVRESARVMRERCGPT